MLTGSRDGTAQLWDSATGRPIGPPMRHSDQVHSVAFSPDARLVLVSGSDGKARLWDTATGQPAGPILSHAPRSCSSRSAARRTVLHDLR